MTLNPMKWLIPPQVRVAFKIAPWALIAGLAMVVLWQRADVVGANAAVAIANADKEDAQDAAAIAVASNRVLTDLVGKAAAAERARGRELQRITNRFEQERYANQQIPPDDCYDGRLPDAAIRLYRGQESAGRSDADRAAGAGGAGSPEHP